MHSATVFRQQHHQPRLQRAEGMGEGAKGRKGPGLAEDNDDAQISKNKKPNTGWSYITLLLRALSIMCFNISYSPDPLVELKVPTV